MQAWKNLGGLLLLLAATLAFTAEPPPLSQAPNTWVKRSPLPGGPPSPALGYEAALVYDARHKVIIRWGGHNQGGGGEQNAETWTFDPATARWTLKEPNTSPPGVCCAQQNVFDPVQQRYLRFRAFSGSHGWHWFRENYLSNSAVWSYDLATNTWRDMRPVPSPLTSPLRCASWDSEHQVVVIFGGEGNSEGTVVYDPYTNTWTRMNPKVQPAFRSGGNMAYDAARQLHILFGSQFSDDPHTWAYDLRKNEWKDLKPRHMPPTDRNDPVLVYDSANQVVIAVVQVVDRPDGKEGVAGRHETWAYDAGKNTWTKMNPPREPDGWGNRRRLMAYLPDYNLTLLEVYVNPTLRVPGVEREQQIWTYRYDQGKSIRHQPLAIDLQVTTTATGAMLTWKADPAVPATEYTIFRTEGDQPWLATRTLLATVGGGQTRYHDKELKPGTVYSYFLTTGTGEQLARGVTVRAQPRLVEDAVVSVLSAREVRLSWTPPPGADIVGYHVERAPVEVLTEDQVLRLKTDTLPLPEPSVGSIKAIGPFVRLTKEPVKEPMFTDTRIDLTKPQPVEGAPLLTHRFRDRPLDLQGKPYRFAVYAYRVQAVNALGVAGGPSPYFLTIPSSPKHLFSKEDGDDCRLKWQANPEQKLKGYRVYRMESPRINGPGQKVTRLTPEPIADTHFTDVKIGKDTRRYWVVAVDALGQEGIPSAPTWHYREWRRFYVPFVGEWHQ